MTLTRQGSMVAVFLEKSLLKSVSLSEMRFDDQGGVGRVDRTPLKESYRVILFPNKDATSSSRHYYSEQEYSNKGHCY